MQISFDKFGSVLQYGLPNTSDGVVKVETPRVEDNEL